MPPVPVYVPAPVNPPSSLALVLVDADKNRDVGPLSSGMTISLGELGSALNVRADPISPPGVGSIVFTLNGAFVRTENVAPYALAGDRKGKYLSWTPPVGQNTITATSYSESKGSGTVIAFVSVSFTVVV